MHRFGKYDDASAEVDIPARAEENCNLYSEQLSSEVDHITYSLHSDRTVKTSAATRHGESRSLCSLRNSEAF